MLVQGRVVEGAGFATVPGGSGWAFDARVDVSAAALASPPLAASASGGHSVESGSSKALPPSLDVGSHSPPTDAGREASSRRPHAASLLVACGVPEALLEDL